MYPAPQPTNEMIVETCQANIIEETPYYIWQKMEQVTTKRGILRHDLTDFKDEMIVSSQSSGRRDMPPQFPVILFKVFDVKESKLEMYHLPPQPA